MQIKLFAVFCSLTVLLSVIELIRRRKMTFKYSVTWLFIPTLALVFTFYDDLLYKLSKLAGFSLPSNFIFFLFLVFFIYVCLVLTVYVNEQNNRSETLAQSIAVLEYKLKQFEAGLPYKK